jgi:hypothetical protein
MMELKKKKRVIFFVMEYSPNFIARIASWI